MYLKESESKNYVRFLEFLEISILLGIALLCYASQMNLLTYYGNN